MPVNEVQVRATTVKNVSNTDENENGNATRSLFNWELIHLKCSQSGATQRRTEKVYQLANTYVYLLNFLDSIFSYSNIFTFFF